MSQALFIEVSKALAAIEASRIAVEKIAENLRAALEAEAEESHDVWTRSALGWTPSAELSASLSALAMPRVSSNLSIFKPVEDEGAAHEDHCSRECRCAGEPAAIWDHDALYEDEDRAASLERAAVREAREDEERVWRDDTPIEGSSAVVWGSFADAAAPAAPAAEPALKKRPARVFSKLEEALPFGTHVSITSGGDKWCGIFKEGGFQVGGAFFKSPYAFGSAHARRMTDKHPAPTKAGNGWLWIMVEDGAAAGKTIAEVYDAHFARA